EKPQETCSRCGRLSPVNKRTADGPVCTACYEQPKSVCIECGKLAPADRATEQGPLCASCARWDRARKCVLCGKERPVAQNLEEGPICGACCAARRPLTLCSRCGTLGRTIKVTATGPICIHCYERYERPMLACYECGRLR